MKTFHFFSFKNYLLYMFNKRRYLRAAGYDTVIIHEPVPDRAILEIAIRDNRLLITRDRHFLKMKRANPYLLYLKSNEFDDCIDELITKININWLSAPFSRCLKCNTLLQVPDQEALTRNVPSKIREEKDHFWYCPSCHHFFWEGSHTKRMRNRLVGWQDQSKNSRL
jgi:uncharacterized protein with PIN domain